MLLFPFASSYRRMLIASAHSDSLIYFVPYSFCLTRKPSVLSASHPAPLPSPENLPPDTGDSEKLIFKAILSLGIHPLLFLRRNLCKNPMSDILHRLYACCSHCLFLCIPPCREVLAVIVLKFHLKCNSGPHTEISVKEPLHRFRVPGKYHNDILSVVFHFPKQCRNSDLALQRICFINE